ncbi:mannose-1-phosphate guanylyltransferase/mannose-6-phosphate isomerase [Methanospirillum stamsii]|uniref:mannose-1-phosphate guanylyltransferase n=1 Tax=Methanospirillum stamsii TaxID=1277351 RepID=A0A2V2NBP2_9EURY|nr:mannose-1-phosphate guanylyltransferase/mannose-6-phosphate isomerase [Methanospirillum stamsii]PWR76160.1 mannose-1-phosphate guanylyltransferase/mannose-6-phosphate isomerase [Methanospirillum stamsii]
MHQIYSVILAGGIGTRLWPLSRTYYPKQFLQVNGHSLFQKTYLRSIEMCRPDCIFIVTNSLHHFLVKNQISELGYQISDEQILLEPSGKNTLPAITWAVTEIQKKSNDARVFVFPSDHLLGEDAIRELKQALPLTDSQIVTFGIVPSIPHTGYGYISPGENLQTGFKVREFKEKPDARTAKEYVDKGYFWNSGIFLFSVPVFKSELTKYQPDIASAFEKGVVWDELPSISIDYGILEHSDAIAVVPLSTSWSDLGNFNAWYEISEKDEQENTGDCVAIDSQGNFVTTQDRFAALIGIQNTIVVETPDALLICRRDMAEKVGDLVKGLKKKNNPITEIHQLVYRPWGAYLGLEKGPGFQIKRITVDPGNRLSLQRHHHRSEHWVVIHGTADVELDGKQFFIRPGESTFVPAGVMHRLGNSGKIPLEVIEVQIGEYLEEDDIERTEDDYQRK